MRHGSPLALAAVLLAACAAPGGAPDPGAGPLPPGVAGSGPFRLRITDAYRNSNPGHGVSAIFDAVLETVDGSPLPQGLWYAENPRLGEGIPLPGGGGLPPGEWIGAPPAFSSRVEFMIRGLREGDSRIRRLAIEIPMLEILEGVSEERTLSAGQEVRFPFGPKQVSFVGQEDGVSVFLMDEGEEVPEEPFYAEGTRPPEHAWSMVDARGIPMNDQGGGGSGTISEFWYSAGPVGQPKGVEFPVTLHWRLPRRWRPTTQRFVFEDVVLDPGRD